MPQITPGIRLREKKECSKCCRRITTPLFTMGTASCHSVHVKISGGHNWHISTFAQDSCLSMDGTSFRCLSDTEKCFWCHHIGKPAKFKYGKNATFEFVVDDRIGTKSCLTKQSNQSSQTSFEALVQKIEHNLEKMKSNLHYCNNLSLLEKVHEISSQLVATVQDEMMSCDGIVNQSIKMKINLIHTFMWRRR